MRSYSALVLKNDGTVVLPVVSYRIQVVQAEWTLQRLFTMFPEGLPGVALVLLRIAVAIGTVSADSHSPHWLLALDGPCVLALVLGAFTPLFAGLSLGLQWVGWAVVGGYPAMRLLAGLVTLALALLGPGAYSFDARRFGRRLMTFSDQDRSSDR